MNLIKSYPLMIGGCPRSGTTALVLMFNSNPSVHITSEENLLNTLRALAKLLGTRERRAKVFKDQGERDLSSRETSTADNILASNFSREAVWPMINYLYQWHHSQLHDDVPLALWGDKYPNYYKDIDNVLDIQGAKYIHITRNPFDVVNSMLRRTEMAKQGKDWWRAITDLDGMIDAWVEAYSTIKRVEEITGVFHLHYEELVFNFEQLISELNKFLSVDLIYKNIMVSEPENHYERSFLNQDIMDLMFARPEILSYIEKHTENHDTPYVSESLKNIIQIQHKGIQKTIEPVRIFIAATPAEWLPARVLEFSIREQTDLPVEVQFLYQSGIDIPEPDDIENKPRTPFSFQRFLIPEICDYSGKAIYLDADMLVFRDISELWNQPFFGCDLQTVQKGDTRRYEQFSVLLLDCERLRWDIEEIVNKLDSGELDYAGLMYNMKVASKIGRDIVPEWNSLEAYNPEATSLLHYTDMNIQPWVSLANSHDHLWISCLRRAIAEGFISEKDIQREVSAKHIRPSLLGQLQTDLDRGIQLPRNIRAMDIGYKAPYRYLNVRFTRPWISPSSWLFASFRKAVYRYTNL